MVTNKLSLAKRIALCAVLAALLSRPAPAWSEPLPTRASGDTSAVPMPSLHHSPVAVAIAGEPLIIRARISHPQAVRRAWVVYSTPALGAARQVEFRRADGEGYMAQIPGADVAAPGLRYSLELERTDGSHVAVFASRAAPQRVQVSASRMDLREEALLRTLDGRRSVVTGAVEYVDFGASRAEIEDPVSGVRSVTSVRDRYLRAETGYTYRPLQLVTEFSLRLGVVRGQSPVPVDGTELAPGTPADERFDVGLNYGAPSVLIRLGDLWHLEGEFLTSITEVGFSVGAGGALHVGDPYGSKLRVGFETVEVFGTRLYTQLDIVATPRLLLSPVVELTDMPHASRYGVRLLGQARFALGQGFSVSARGGYQARFAAAGGVTLGTSLSYAWSR